jgi:hypothetical protein
MQANSGTGQFTISRSEDGGGFTDRLRLDNSGNLRVGDGLAIGNFTLDTYIFSNSTSGASLAQAVKGWTFRNNTTTDPVLTVNSVASQTADLFRTGINGTYKFRINKDSALDFVGQTTPGVSAAGEGRIYFDSGTNKFRCSEAGAAFVDCIGSGGGGGGSGTVTSVALALPGIFSVSGSPVTTSGTLTGTLATQSANWVFAGPSSGGAATPTFRALATADFPASGVAAASYTCTNLTVDSTGRITSATSGSCSGGGGGLPAATLVAANYTTLSTDWAISADATGAARTITLLSAASAGAGKIISVFKRDATVNTVSVNDGSVTHVIYAAGAGIQFISNGSIWVVHGTF